MNIDLDIIIALDLSFPRFSDEIFLKPHVDSFGRAGKEVWPGCNSQSNESSNTENQRINAKNVAEWIIVMIIIPSYSWKYFVHASSPFALKILATGWKSNCRRERGLIILFREWEVGVANQAAKSQFAWIATRVSKKTSHLMMVYLPKAKHVKAFTSWSPIAWRNTKVKLCLVRRSGKTFRSVTQNNANKDSDGMPRGVLSPEHTLPTRQLS